MEGNYIMFEDFGVEDVIAIECESSYDSREEYDSFFDMSYIPEELLPYDSKLATKASSLKAKFVRTVLYANAKRYDDCIARLRSIVREFNSCPALIRYCRADKLIELLKQHLLSELYFSATTGIRLPEKVKFLFYFYQEYLQFENPEMQDKFFTLDEPISNANSNAKSRTQPVKPALNLDSLICASGTYGMYIQAICICKDTLHIKHAFSLLKGVEDKLFLCSTLKLELTNHCLFELYQHSIDDNGVSLPKCLELKCLILRLLFEANSPEECDALINHAKFSKELIDTEEI